MKKILLYSHIFSIVNQTPSHRVKSFRHWPFLSTLLQHGHGHVLLNKMTMLLMPPLKTILTIKLMHALLPLRPPRPSRLRSLHDANHFIRHRQLRINCGSKWMDEFRPVVVPYPEHGTAIRAEAALRVAELFVWCSAVPDCGVFSRCISLFVNLW
jgi:hypothetical protein